MSESAGMPDVPVDDDQQGLYPTPSGPAVPFQYLPQEQQAQLALAAQSGQTNPTSPPNGGKLSSIFDSLPSMKTVGNVAGDLGAGVIGSAIGIDPSTAVDAVNAIAGAASANNEPQEYTPPAFQRYGPQVNGAPLQSPAAPPALVNRGSGGGGGDAMAATLNQGINEQKTAAQQEADIAGQKAEAEQRILQSPLSDDQKLIEWQKAHADETQNFVNRHMEDLQKQMMDFRKTAVVNPNQFWQNLPIGARIGNLGAMILGGFFGGASGQPNKAELAINDAIKRNTDAQLENIKNKRSSIDDQSNLIGQYLKNGMDMSQAKAAAMATQRDMVKDQILANAAGYAPGIAQAEAQKFAGILDAGKAKDLNEFKDSSVRRAAEAQAMKFQAANENYALQNRGGLIHALQGGPIDLSNPEIASRAIRLPTGETTLAARPEDAEKGRALVTASTAYDNALTRVGQTAAKAGTIPWTQAHDAYDLAVKQAMAAGKGYYKIKSNGQGGDEEEPSGIPSDLLSALAGKGGTDPIRIRNTLARIKEIQSAHRDDLYDQLRANNAQIHSALKTNKTPFQ